MRGDRAPLLITLALLRAAWRAKPRSVRSRVTGDPSPTGVLHMFSILVGFGVATLCATAFLFLMHMAED
jgi:hypothetical protein